jgi:hypothetical protein
MRPALLVALLGACSSQSRSTRDLAAGPADAAAAPAADAASPDTDVPCPAPPGMWCSETLAPGVHWRARSDASLYCGAQRVNVLDVDLAQPGLSVLPVKSAGPVYETVASMGARTHAVAGINGGFFCNGADDICTANPPSPTCDTSVCSGGDKSSTGACSEPEALSLLQIAGQSISTNCGTSARSTLGIDATGRNLQIGRLMPGATWPSQASAIGAGPNLVSPSPQGGDGIVDLTDEGFNWPCSLHARSAAGLDGRGHLLFVTFDGKHGAAGVTLPQLAEYLVRELHLQKALNLDGGGSTSLYVGGRGLVNTPSDDSGGPTPRPVFDGLFVYAQ